MSDFGEQYEGKFGEVYRSLDMAEPLMVMVIRRKDISGDHEVIYLNRHDRRELLDRWGLFKRQWERVDGT